MKCERPGCNGERAELSRIAGITRRMCLACTKEMVLKEREKQYKNNGGVFK
jgi:hypothetical protein